MGTSPPWPSTNLDREYYDRWGSPNRLPHLSILILQLDLWVGAQERDSAQAADFPTIRSSSLSMTAVSPSWNLASSTHSESGSSTISLMPRRKGRAPNVGS